MANNHESGQMSRKVQLSLLRAQIADKSISTAALRRLRDEAKHKKVRQVAYAELLRRKLS
jgi:hypothetical protein